MRDLESVQRHAVRQDVFKQFTQLRHLPLAIAQVIDETTFGLGTIDFEDLIEGVVGRVDAQVTRGAFC